MTVDESDGQAKAPQLAGLLLVYRLPAITRSAFPRRSGGGYARAVRLPGKAYPGTR